MFPFLISCHLPGLERLTFWVPYVYPQHPNQPYDHARVGDRTR